MSHPPNAAIEAVVFDLGGVLIDWDPRHLYRTLFDDEEAMERFLADVVSQDWNAQQDAGRSWADAVASLAADHPEHHDLIVAYRERWAEMLGGPIDGTVAVLADVVAAGLPAYALSNWSAETFPIAVSRYEFLSLFRGIVVSGDVRLVKPDPRIFRHLVDRYGLRAEATVFIDDSAANVAAARSIGMVGLDYRDPETLRRDLTALGIRLPTAVSDSGPPDG